MKQNRLKELFSYDAETGAFTWLVNKGAVKAGAIAGAPDSYGYVKIQVDGKKYAAHRFAWLYVHGEFPPNEIDHINGVPDDNRLANLRAVTHTENLRNQKRHCNNTSGTAGVYWNKAASKWHAYIAIGGGKVKYLGIYVDLFDAVCARKSAELKHNFHINHGRA